jgi:putative FmdB family regulatory protein
MLLYDFRCDDCGRVFEELVESRDDEVRCPACASASATRQLSGFSIGRSDGGTSRVTSDAARGGGCFGGACGTGMCGL